MSAQAELKAMGDCWAVLRELDPETRKRVAWWLLEHANDSEPTDRDDGYSVRLLSSGEWKVSVVKVLRYHVSSRLKDAKALVESAPTVVASGLNARQANDLANELKGVGAVAEVVCP